MEKRHRHHVIPRHLGGSDDPENLVELDFIEHARVHAERFLAGEDTWFDNRHPGWPYLDAKLTEEIRKRQSEIYSKKNKDLAKEGLHPAQIAVSEGRHNWQSEEHREKSRQFMVEYNERCKNENNLPSQRPEVKEKMAKAQKLRIERGDHFFGSNEHRRQAREKAIRQNKKNKGAKHWVNAKGERKFQKESPGPDWQNGQKWKG